MGGAACCGSRELGAEGEEGSGVAPRQTGGAQSSV